MSGEAAIIIAMQNRIMNRFMDHNAVSPEQAKTIEDLGLKKNLLFNKLLRRGVLVQTPDERYYIIPEKAAQYKRRRRIIILIVMAVVLAAFGLIVWLA